MIDWHDAKPVFRATYQLLDEQDERTTPQAVCEALGQVAGHDPTVLALAYLYDRGLIDGRTIQQSPAPALIEPTPAGQSLARELT